MTYKFSGLEVIAKGIDECMCGKGYVSYTVFEDSNCAEIVDANLCCIECAKKYHLEMLNRDNVFDDCVFYLVPNGRSINEEFSLVSKISKKVNINR
ncbi:MAG: hypothetical protein IJD76_02655 [Bacilli bacterium]|nr:hypothetical protein [Bacilli bacterium]